MGADTFVLRQRGQAMLALILISVAGFRGVWGVRGRVGGAGLAVGLWLLAQLSGCASSSDGGGKQCASLCGDLCKALAACDANVPSNCISQCSAGVSGADCSSARPPKQLTCAELKETYACADYCATLCARAPTCGSFDPKLCAQGCTSQSPSICNPASVDARTCDQLKPELRDYEDTGRAEQGGSHISIGFGGTSPYGLCTKADDCALPQGCALSTNTCSPCESDGDCKRSTYHHMCSAEKECVKVECVEDRDCGSSRVCDAERHVCVQCRENVDCADSSYGKTCNTQTSQCVVCLSDRDCSGRTPRCDLSASECSDCANSCVQCLSNDDCPNKQSLPRCDLERHICSLCQGDSQCPSGTFCTTSGGCDPK